MRCHFFPGSPGIHLGLIRQIRQVSHRGLPAGKHIQNSGGHLAALAAFLQQSRHYFLRYLGESILAFG